MISAVLLIIDLLFTVKHKTLLLVLDERRQLVDPSRTASQLQIRDQLSGGHGKQEKRLELMQTEINMCNIFVFLCGCHI